MEKDPVMVIVMATMLEAKPFVECMGLEQINKKPFLLFQKNNRILILSGIGKANAAMATGYCCHTFKPSCVFNLGAAGTTNASHELGSIYHIDKIIEVDRPDLKTGTPCIHTPHALPGFQSATLSTSDRAVLEPTERKEISLQADLMDMEGASVVQTCNRFDTPCYLFKFVSDTPEHTLSNHIRNNIRMYRSAFCEFFVDDVLPKVDLIQN